MVVQPNPLPKIFAVGFNKCGTRSLHRFFERNGIPSVHWRVETGNVNIAAAICWNIWVGRPVLSGLESFTAFSDIGCHRADLWIEGNSFFRQFNEQYPNALFIFNDRPVENWIRSRRNHGDLMTRAQRWLGVSEAEVEQHWRRQYQTHRDALLAYAPCMRHFLHFDIEAELPERLVEFLSPVFDVAVELYQHEGATVLT